VDVVDLTNIPRLTVFVIEAEAVTGQICINGAAARLVQPGDVEFLFAAAHVDQAQDRTLAAGAVFVDHCNRMVEVGGDPKVVPNSVGVEVSRTPQVRSGEHR
jgi:aspartate 1-decarboxylase